MLAQPDTPTTLDPTRAGACTVAFTQRPQPDHYISSGLRLASLDYAAKLSVGGHSGWRLPSVKELQSLVDYSISFEEDGVPAISPLFTCSRIGDPEGIEHVPYYWTGTTLLDGPTPGDQAAYVVFGRALARPEAQLVDAHGSGAVRADPKSERAGGPRFFGPQGDYREVFNFVRCVRSMP